MVWDISSRPGSAKISNKPLFTIDHPGIVFSIAFDKGGAKLATGIQDGTARIWNAVTGKEIQILRGHRDAVSSVAFDPSGKFLATGSLDSTAKVWELPSGRELFTLRGHTGAVASIAYSPDSSRIATASRDGTAKLWDATTGEELLNFSGDGSELNDIAFSPDGTRLAVGGIHGVRIYLLHIEDLIALAETRVTRSLTSEECQKYLHSDVAACASTISIPTTTPFPPTTDNRICQVTNTGGLYDHSFNQLVFKGTQDAITKFQWDAKVLQSASLPDFEKNIKEFLRGDCDLIVGLPPLSDAIRLAAEANPNQKFQLMEFAYDPAGEQRLDRDVCHRSSCFPGRLCRGICNQNRKSRCLRRRLTSRLSQISWMALRSVLLITTRKMKLKVEVLGWDVKKHEGLFVGEFCCAAEGRQLTQQLLMKARTSSFPWQG